MRKKLGAIFTAFFDPLVIVTMITTISLIVGVLAYAVPKPSKLTLGFCILVAFLGGMTMIIQMRVIMHRKYIADKLRAFLLEGYALLSQSTNLKEHPPQEKANQWATEVENFLKKELDTSYTYRFCSSSGLVLLSEPDIDEGPHINLWRGINTRILRLEQFLRELPRQ